MKIDSWMVACAIASALEGGCLEDLKCADDMIEVNGACQCPKDAVYVPDGGTCRQNPDGVMAKPNTDAAITRPEPTIPPLDGGSMDASVRGGSARDASVQDASRSDRFRDSEWYIAEGRIRNVALNLCLDVVGADRHTAGASVQARGCDISPRDPKPAQIWRQENSGDNVVFKNQVSELCLGVRDVDHHDVGAEAEVYICDPGGSDLGRDNRWNLEALGGGRYHLRNALSKHCLGVTGMDDGAAGAGVEVNLCSKD